MRSSSRPLFLGLALIASLGVAAGAPGCSFATNETAVQCTSEAECLSLGPAFAGTTCDKATKTCVRVAEDADLCTSNQQCIDQSGLPSICRKRDRKCVPLLSKECPTLLAKAGQLSDDNTIVVGALTPAAHTELGDVMEAAMSLAQTELSTQVRGLPSPEDGSGPVRPFVIVSCREFNSDGFNGLNRAANHLSKDIGVPLVIGPVDPANANFTMTEVMIPNRTFVILPLGIPKTLYSLSTGPTPMMWSATATDTATTIAAQEFISKSLEQKIKTERGKTSIKVALMQEDNFFGEGGASNMEQRLRFNGKTVLENLNDNNYLRVNIGNLIDPVGNPAPAAKVAAAVQAVQAFKPDIVIHAYAPAAIPPTFFSLVLDWPQGTPHAYHIDILTTFSVFAPLLDIINLIPPLRQQVFSVANHNPPETQQRIAEFLIRFRAQFPQFRASNTAEGAIVHQWYDSTYMAAYAIVANRAKPLTGENLSATISLLQPPGTLIKTGTQDISKAFGLLNSGQGIDLDGISGTMNLDPRTGAPAPDYDIDLTCPALDQASGRITRFKASGFFTVGGVGSGAAAGCGL